MTRLLAVASLLAPLLVGACATGGAESPFQAGEGGARTVRIEVRNHNFADATLHAYRGSERIRMGVVTGVGDRTFTVPWTMSQELRIEIDLLAGGRCFTRPMSVSPGDVIQLQIEVDLRTGLDCVGAPV